MHLVDIYAFFMHIANMSDDDFTKNFFSWMDSNEINYKQVANDLYIGNPRTVSNWRSSGIPKGKKIACQALMDAHNKPTHITLIGVIEVEPTKEQLTAWKTNGLVRGNEFTEFALNRLDALAEAISQASQANLEVTSLADHQPAKKKAHLMAAAGSEIMAEVVDWKAGNNLINVKVTGESMQPTLKDGDVVTMLLREAWEGNNEVRKGMIYLFELDGGLLIKEYNTRPATQEEIDSDLVYKALGGSMRVRVLLSHNSDFPERVIDNDSIKPIALYDQKFN